jgi:uncharacterized protein (TIGR02231 family)
MTEKITDIAVKNGEDNSVGRVTIFQSEAWVTRTGKVSVGEGIHKIQVEVLALALESQSAQAQVFGEGEILSVQYQEIPVVEAPQENLRELEKQVEELDHKIDIVRKKRVVFDKKLRFLDSLVGFAEQEMPKRIQTQFPNSEELQSSLEFIDSGYSDTLTRDLDLANELKELNREKTVLKAKTNKQRRGSNKYQYLIEILFNSAKEQEVEFEASYMAAGTGWRPVYRVDVPNDLSSVVLTMKAHIEQQKTGEDWNDIEMTFSNAAPMQGLELPEPKPWPLDIPQVAAAAGATNDQILEFAMEAPRSASARLSKARRKVAEEPEDMLYEEFEEMRLPEANWATASEEKLPIAFEYKLPQPVTLKHGDTDNQQPISHKEIETKFLHYAVPRENPHVYLVCEAKPDSSLLNGQMNLHFAGRFLGQTRLEEKKPGETFLLNLGVDREVKSARETLEDKVNETFFNMVDRHNPARHIKYRISLENMKDKPITMRVFDSLPIPQNDRISVKGPQVWPEPETRNYRDREGVMMWNLELQPSETKEITTSFHVKHPKDVEPTGL